MKKHYAPSYNEDAFYCLHCNVYAKQIWESIDSDYLSDIYYERQEEWQVRIDDNKVEYSLCSHCEKPTFWLQERILYPNRGTFPSANEDLPDKVKAIYNEAGAIAHHSPRAACALLRLAVQILLKELGEKGSINDAIGNLVRNGLDTEIQQALDTVRVTGNHAVHPGEIVFDDDTDTGGFFELINSVVYDLITIPKKREKMYAKLPQKDRDHIAKRDLK